MKLGYYDAKRMLYGLAGRSYYIDAPQSEAYYFDKMMSELELLKLQLFPHLDEEERGQLSGYRAFTERVFPALADQLKLGENWDYRELYLALLEAWAKKLKMNRLHIYAVDEIVQNVYIHLGKLDSLLPL